MSITSLTLKQVLFSFNGRVGRPVFWIWNACYYAAVFLLSVGMNALFPEASYLILPIFLICVLIPDLAVTAKRFHDRNKSARWLVLFIPVYLGRVMVPTPDQSQPTFVPTDMQQLISLAALICGVWIFVECGLLPAKNEDNLYGDAS